MPIPVGKEIESMPQKNPDSKSRSASTAATAPPASPDSSAPVSLPPYESDLVCDFFRQIGRLEVAHRYEIEVRQAGLSLFDGASASCTEAVRQKAVSGLQALLSTPGFEQAKPWTALVGNAQNPLDHLVGDVLGRSEAGRYFIIEFKRETIGFVEEVDLRLGKPDRAALLDHLRSDSTCQKLSQKGHFGAHWTPSGIGLQRYLALITAKATPLITVQKFFVDVMLDGKWGWSATELRDYIDCMTAHGIQIKTDSGNLVFGYFTQEAEFVSMTGSASIIAMIQTAFKRADAHRYQQQPVPANTNRLRPTYNS